MPLPGQRGIPPPRRPFGRAEWAACPCAAGAGDEAGPTRPTTGWAKSAPLLVAAGCRPHAVNRRLDRCACVARAELLGSRAAPRNRNPTGDRLGRGSRDLSLEESRWSRSAGADRATLLRLL